MGGGPASVARPKAHSVRLIYDVSRSSRTKIMRPESSVSFSSAIARCDPSPSRVCQRRTRKLAGSGVKQGSVGESAVTK